MCVFLSTIYWTALFTTLPALAVDASRKRILLQLLRVIRELSRDPESIEALIETKAVASIVPFLKSPEQVCME